MSYPSVPPRAYQIDVVDQVGRAYRAVFDSAQLVGEMALLPYLAVLAVVLLERLLIGPNLVLTMAGVTAGGIIGFGLSAGVALIVPFAMLLVITVFIVRWHRFLLLGESVSGGLIPPGYTGFLIVGLKLGAALFAGWIVLVAIALLPPLFLTVPLSGLGGVALTLFALRVSLIFPAAAIGRPIAFRTAWDWVNGNFWRLFASAFACYFPFIVLQMLIHALASIFPSVTSIIFEALRLAISFVGAGVVAALLSHLYREIEGDAPRA